MGSWESVATTVIALAIIGVLGWGAKVLLDVLKRRWDDRAVWSMTPEPRGGMMLRNASKRTMFEAKYTVTRPDEGYPSMQPDTVGFADCDPAICRVIDAEVGSTIMVAWIDGKRRAASVTVEPDVEGYRVSAQGAVKKVRPRK